MAGIGDALGMMFAGAAGEAAGNRSQAIGEEDKARLAQAREEKMMALQQKYNTSEREATQGFQSGEAGKDREFRSGEAQKDRDFRAQQQAQQIAASASEGAANRASRAQLADLKQAGKGPDAEKKLKGTPMLIPGDDISGKAASIIYNYEDGTSEKIDIEDLPGGANYAGNKAKEKAGQLADDLKYAQNEMGEEAKPKGYTANQQAMINRVKQKYPDASDDDIAAAIRNDPQKSTMFK